MAQKQQQHEILLINKWLYFDYAPQMACGN